MRGCGASPQASSNIALSYEVFSTSPRKPRARPHARSLPLRHLLHHRPRERARPPDPGGVASARGEACVTTYGARAASSMSSRLLLQDCTSTPRSHRLLAGTGALPPPPLRPQLAVLSLPARRGEPADPPGRPALSACSAGVRATCPLSSPTISPRAARAVCGPCMSGWSVREGKEGQGFAVDVRTRPPPGKPRGREGTCAGVAPPLSSFPSRHDRMRCSSCCLAVPILWKDMTHKLAAIESRSSVCQRRFRCIRRSFNKIRLGWI